MGWGEKVASVIGVVGPVIALIVAIALSWGWGFTWVDAVLLVGGYVITALGVTVGYHRYFTHKSFKTNAFGKAMLAIIGSTAVEGNPVKWAAMHRCHHQHSDHEHDPHSPHHHGGGVKGVLKGFFHAHVGWIFRGDPKDLERYNPDLRADKVVTDLRPAVGAVGGPGLRRAGGAGRAADVELVGRAARLPVGRPGAAAGRAPRHLEREQHLPPVGHAAVQEQRRVAEQLVLRLLRPGRGLAQQPPRLPDQRPPRPAVVGVRPQLPRDPRRWAWSVWPTTSRCPADKSWSASAMPRRGRR